MQLNKTGSATLPRVHHLMRIGIPAVPGILTPKNLVQLQDPQPFEIIHPGMEAQTCVQAFMHIKYEYNINMEGLKTAKYTRKQIAEAIRFWSKVLENTSPFIDALVDSYGYDQVFADVKRKVTMKDIERIYTYAKTILFKNDLSSIQILRDEDDVCSESNTLMMYSYVTYQVDDTTYLLTQKGVDSLGCVYLPPRIYVSKELLDSIEINLISLASIIVHEMIHQHIVENACPKELETMSENNGHNLKFIKMMDELNSEHGLNIKTTGASRYQEDSVDKLNDFVKTESDDVVERKRTMSITKKHESGFIETFLA